MRNGFVNINNNIFSTLLALSEEEQTKGLMGQQWLPPIMSFVYLQPKINKFWMKNTPSPLDIVFSCRGKITQIHKGNPNSTEIIGNDTTSDLIIEYPYGTVSTSNIKLGQTVKLFMPSFEEIRKIISIKI